MYRHSNPVQSKLAFVKGNVGGVPFNHLGYSGIKGISVNTSYSSYQHYGDVHNNNSSNCGNTTNSGTIVNGNNNVLNKDSNGSNSRLFSNRNVHDLVGEDNEKDCERVTNKKPHYKKEDVSVCNKVVCDLTEKYGCSKSTALELFSEANPNKTPCKRTLNRHLLNASKPKDDSVKDDKRLANVEFDGAIQDKLWLTSLSNCVSNASSVVTNRSLMQKQIANIVYSYDLVRQAAIDVKTIDAR